MNMKTNYKSLFTLLGVVVLTLAMLTSCVDIPTEAPPLPDFKAKLRVIHVATDVGDPGVKINGVGVGALAFGNSTAYQTVDAGRHAFQAGSEKADTLFIDTDFSGTVFMATKDANNTRRFIKMREHWLYTDVAPADMGKIFITQMVTGAALKIDLVTVEGGTETPATLSSGLAFSRYVSKTLTPTGKTYYYNVYDGATLVKKIDFTVSAGKAKHHVLYNTKADLMVKEFGNE